MVIHDVTLIVNDDLQQAYRNHLPGAPQEGCELRQQTEQCNGERSKSDSILVGSASVECSRCRGVDLGSDCPVVWPVVWPVLATIAGERSRRCCTQWSGPGQLACPVTVTLRFINPHLTDSDAYLVPGRATRPSLTQPHSTSLHPATASTAHHHSMTTTAPGTRSAEPQKNHTPLALLPRGTDTGVKCLYARWS